MCTDHVNNTPTLWKMHATSFFSDPFLMIWAYLHELPYLEMCTDHVKSTSTLSTIVYMISIHSFLSFPDFLVMFLLITILENAHTLCKQCTNIVDNDLHLSLHFFLIYFSFSEYIYINYHIRKCTHTM